MERVKHLKVPPTNYFGNRSRSASIDMIVMDEISKNGNWTATQPPNPNLVVVGDNNNNTDVNNNNNNNNSNNNNNNNSPNITTPPSSNSGSTQNTLSQAGIFHINLSQLNNNNNNSANNSTNNSPRYFSSLSSLQQPTIHPSPPVSPRTQMTAPNLSTFIAQHTPPPSPKPSDDLRHFRHSNHLSPPPFTSNPLHHSGIYRNLSFNSSLNSMSSIDISSKLLLQQAQQAANQQLQTNNNNNNNNVNNNTDNNNNNELTQSKIINARRKRKKTKQNHKTI